MILIDRQMPEACNDCPCNYDYINCTALKDNTHESLSAVIDYTIRQKWCPLKELVRCKDCYNGVIHCENGDIICDHVDSSGNDTHPADWFCADGEAKG